MDEERLEFDAPHRDKDDGFWGWFSHDAIIRAAQLERLPGVAVYTALCFFESKAPSKYKSGFAVSLKELSGISCVGITTLQRVLSTLEKAGLIQVISGRRCEKGQPNLANLYRVTGRKKRGGLCRQPTKPYVASRQTHCQISSQKSDNQERDSFPLSHEAQSGKEGGIKERHADGKTAKPLSPLASDGQRVAGADASEEGQQSNARLAMVNLANTLKTAKRTTSQSSDVGEQTTKGAQAIPSQRTRGTRLP